ncbi:MAG: glycosyltransferase family 4 protein [Anaerolineales bacterium]
MTSILFIDHASAIGGAQRSLLLLLEYLDKHHWSPHLGCVPGSLAAHAHAAGIPTHPLRLPRLRRSPRFPLDWLAGARAIARLAHQIQAYLLVSNTVRAASYCALASRSERMPFVWHMRDFWLSETRPRWIFADALGKKILSRAASLVIANSAATARHLPHSDKLQVVPNGIEVEKFNPSPGAAREFRNRFDIPLDSQLVGTAGRMRPWKGQERFLHMAQQVLTVAPDTHFVLVGGDPFNMDSHYERDLIRLARNLSIGDRVTFTGHLEDVRPALAAMHIFVHPGDPEPFGLVNLEAMASGKPVVAFDHGALPEIVLQGETGVLVPPEDPAHLAHAVIGLLKDPHRRTEMGQRGRQRACSHFKIQDTAAKTAQLYERLLQ